MGDIRKHAKELLEDLNTIETGDLKKKIRLQEKMKKIIGLTDEQIKSKDIKDISKILTGTNDIVNVYKYFIDYPQFEEKVRIKNCCLPESWEVTGKGERKLWRIFALIQVLVDFLATILQDLFKRI